MHEAKLDKIDIKVCAVKFPVDFHLIEQVNPVLRAFSPKESPPLLDPLIASACSLDKSIVAGHPIISIAPEKSLYIPYACVFCAEISPDHSWATAK